MHSLQLIFWSVAAIVALVVAPIAMIVAAVAHFRTRASDRPGSGSLTAGIGAALQEIDRLSARPSVEHQVELEHRTPKREDDAGGE